MLSPQLIVTRDGSHTLFVPELNEHYHSVHGAVNESNHVFIKNGLLPLLFQKKEINLLEIGFGTGLNCFLSALAVSGTHQKIHYTGIEKYPLSQNTISKLNHFEILEALENSSIYHQMHNSLWGKDFQLTSNFSIKRLNVDLLDYKPESNYFDLIYFDAFAPQVQNKLWTIEVFEKMFKCLASGGALVTYCAKGEVKRTMKNVGFKVESLAGPPGKREMTRAVAI